MSAAAADAPAAADAAAPRDTEAAPATRQGSSRSQDATLDAQPTVPVTLDGAVPRQGRLAGCAPLGCGAHGGVDADAPPGRGAAHGQPAGPAAGGHLKGPPALGAASGVGRPAGGRGAGVGVVGAADAAAAAAGGGNRPAGADQGSAAATGCAPRSTLSVALMCTSTDVRDGGEGSGDGGCARDSFPVDGVVSVSST